MTAAADLARETTASNTTGTITLNGAVSGYLTWLVARVPAGVVNVGIKDGTKSENGRYLYDGNVTITALSGSGARVPESSTESANGPIALSGNAEVYLTLMASDVSPLSLLAHRAFGGL